MACRLGGALRRIKRPSPLIPAICKFVSGSARRARRPLGSAGPFRGGNGVQPGVAARFAAYVIKTGAQEAPQEHG